MNHEFTDTHMSREEYDKLIKTTNKNTMKDIKINTKQGWMLTIGRLVLFIGVMPQNSPPIITELTLKQQ